LETETGSINTGARIWVGRPGKQPAGALENSVSCSVCSVSTISSLDTVTKIKEGRKSRSRFLIDMGAHLSVCKESSLQQGLRYCNSNKLKKI
jgi:hypothetical protein